MGKLAEKYGTLVDFSYPSVVVINNKDFAIAKSYKHMLQLLKENNEKEDELLDLTEFTKESLKGMIRQEVQNYFEDTFETDLPIEDEVDEELQKIINELEFEFN